MLHINNESNIYFCTFTVINWIDVFSRQRYRDILIASFKFSQENKGLKVYAFVIMSNHVHCILAADGDNLSDIIGGFKSFTAKKIINSIANEPGESRKEWMIGQMKYVAKARKLVLNTNFGRKVITLCLCITMSSLFKSLIIFIKIL